MLRCAGNWTAGQTFGHLAVWIECSYDGYPFRAPAEMAAWTLVANVLLNLDETFAKR